MLQKTLQSNDNLYKMLPYHHITRIYYMLPIYSWIATENSSTFRNSELLEFDIICRDSPFENSLAAICFS